MKRRFLVRLALVAILAVVLPACHHNTKSKPPPPPSDPAPVPEKP
jgi:hypothetical protein